MKIPHFLKSEDGLGASLKSIIAFGSWLAVTSAFAYVTYLQGKDFKSELFYSYTFSSLIGYGPKLFITAIDKIKGNKSSSDVPIDPTKEK